MKKFSFHQKPGASAFLKFEKKTSTTYVQKEVTNEKNKTDPNCACFPIWHVGCKSVASFLSYMYVPNTCGNRRSLARFCCPRLLPDFGTVWLRMYFLMLWLFLIINFYGSHWVSLQN